MRGIEATEAPSRDRRAGDARHLATFVIVGIIVVLGLLAADRWAERWMSPRPPLWLSHLENDEIVSRFTRGPAESDDLPLHRKRTLLEAAGSRYVLPDDDASIIDRFARAQQYALDLRDAVRRADLILDWMSIVLLGAAASRVDYRWRDGLLWWIPFVGVALAFVVLWRMTSPIRYWTLAEDRVHRPIPFGRTGIGFVAGIAGALVLLALAWVIHDLTS